LRPEVRPINVLVREFDVLATRMLGEAIEVSFMLAPDAGACDVDPAQFGSALLNLVVNARDAMPDGGRLLIRTSNCSLDSRAASQHSEARPGQYVVVEVTDSGTGMSPEVAERAMEPFYTTKQPGQGTGLGLSQVYGFVRQSEGFVLLESAPGVGTTVRIHLPQAAAAVSPRSPAPQMPSGSGRVLVVEDDALVRDLVAAQLEDLGYETVSAGSGPEALQMLSSGDCRIDLMLTDMVMPGGMSGAELIRQARRRQSDLRVVLTSGYVSGSIPAGSGEVPSDIPMLSKPYRQMELARIIQQELGKRV
jgi:CheY-like chemotaxis protein